MRENEKNQQIKPFARGEKFLESFESPSTQEERAGVRLILFEKNIFINIFSKNNLE